MKIYTLKEARDILKISDRTIRRYIEDGKLGAFMVGNNYRITHEDLMRYIEENRVVKQR